jgi:3-oxoadipate enol-lactonase
MKIQANGIAIHAEIHGPEGAPWLVLSHSLACSTGMWTPQIEALADRYRILAFDTRGHGLSEAPSGPYTLDLLADDLHALLQVLDVRRPHYCGLSMGGMIGQTFALKYPGVLRSLTLADTTSRYPADAAAVWAQRIALARAEGMGPLATPTLERWFTPAFRQQHPDVVDTVRRLILATPVAGYIGCSEAIPKINLTERLHAIDCPVLVIVGEDDPGTPVAMAREIHDHTPGSQLVVLPQAAHLANLEQPQAFTRALEEFLLEAAG